ncbi:MAG: hypothetical protein JKY49_12720 [Cohaesibacteraceae bacterium]|nr:hypothetical protein [Cohaesibacteraceae bacterium]
MNKRQFVKLCLTAIGTGFVSLPEQVKAINITPGSLIDGRVSFGWSHDTHRVRLSMSAPTAGWLAIGFNEHPGLGNMRFVMAVASEKRPRAEEHLTRNGSHFDVRKLNLETHLKDLEGAYNGEFSQIRFSLPHSMRHRPTLQLAGGSQTNLILAWSQDTDFNHHSAWRKHYPITL